MSLPKSRLAQWCREAITYCKEMSEILVAFKKEINDFISSLNKVLREIESEDLVSIALLGKTGAGKSSLINSLLGGNFLPWSNEQSCTATLTRVRFQEIDTFRVKISFITPEQWQDTLEQIKLELDEQVEDNEFNPSVKKQKSIKPKSKIDGDKLKSVYGKEMFETFCKNRNLKSLTLGKSATNALQSGFHLSDVKSDTEVYKLLESYLVKTGDMDQLWPLVKDVTLEGRFDVLRHGTEIVDLPGLDDVNAARSANAIKQIKQAKFIFVIYESWRTPGQVITEIFEFEDLKTRLTLDSKSDALTFVGTKSEVFGPNHPDFEDLGVNASMTQKMGRLYEKRQLALSQALAELAIEVSDPVLDEEDANRIKRAIEDSKAFMTSSDGYRDFGKTSITNPESEDCKFLSMEETQIPALKNHIKLITLDAGPRSLYESVVTQLHTVDKKMHSLLTSQTFKWIEEGGIQNKRIDEFRTRVDDVSRNINLAISEISQASREKVKQAGEDFFLITEYKEREIQKSVLHFENELRKRHWATLRATVRRSGIYYSFAERDTIDLAKIASVKLIEKITGPWIDIFGNQIVKVLEHFEIRVNSEFHNYLDQVNNAKNDISHYANVSSEIEKLLEGSVEIFPSDIKQLRSNFLAEVQETRGSLIEIIVDSARDVLEPAISQAALESGPGLKARMIEHLTESSNDLALQVYDKVKSRMAIEIDKTQKSMSDFIDSVPKIINEANSSITRFANGATRKPNQYSKVDLDRLEASLDRLTDNLISLTGDIAKQGLAASNDFESKPKLMDSKLPYIVIDGSNVSTRTNSRNERYNDLDSLLNCYRAAAKEYPGHNIEIYVDASFSRYLRKGEEKTRYRDLVWQRKVTEGKIGIVGDKEFLKHAERMDGRVISNDNFRIESKIFSFLLQSGRVIRATEWKNDEWTFEEVVSPPKCPMCGGIRRHVTSKKVRCSNCKFAQDIYIGN